VRLLRSRYALLLGLLAGGGVLFFCLLASIRFGAAEIGTGEVMRAFTDYDGSEEDLIIRTLRVPRALIAALVGASLGVAGAIMQGLTRNPLAEPGILGINAGAALAVVGAVFLFGASSLTTYALFAFVGAGVAAVVVYGLGSLGRGGMTPMKVTVAGAALAALLSSLTTAILILNQRTLDEIRFWLAGSVAGRDLTLLLQVLPYISVGLLLALALSRQITTLTLGEDVATGLGQRTAWVKALAAIAVVLLAGSAVAIAGPIAFVGLVIPHVVRFFVGVDYRWIMPYAALFGAILLVSADIAARVVVRPQELPVGVMTALVGAPFFIWLARWRVKR
jgi:iron complex transport system permease protein